MKKKILTIALVGLMAASLAACGKASETQTSNAASESASDGKAESKSDGTAQIKTVEAGKLTLATNAEFPPYEYHDGDKIVGIDMDIADAIAKKLGLEVQIEDIAFDSVILEVTSGKADIGLAGISATDERKQSVDFSDTYTTSKQLIIVKDDSAIKGSKDLEGKTVGVQTGTTGDILASDIKDVKPERYDKGMDAVQALSQGKVDAVIIDSEVAKKFVEETSGLKVLDEAFADENYAIAIKKGNKELLDSVNKALSELKSDGTIDSIIAKYIKAE
ncbi:MAG: basic amino acid ABC transporter substrate-binding protein [Lachnospiraceae bacterium]|nr:MAG: basic amino acid ABC transporter substrate-binding protein [Lachnospiraceae bacterium]